MDLSAPVLQAVSKPKQKKDGKTRTKKKETKKNTDLKADLDDAFELQP